LVKGDQIPEGAKSAEAITWGLLAVSVLPNLLLFYFSGHGVLDDRGQSYLALKDTDSKLLRWTAIPARYITAEIDNSQSQRQVLILDCCHSGAFASGCTIGTAWITMRIRPVPIRAGLKMAI